MGEFEIGRKGKGRNTCGGRRELETRGLMGKSGKKQEGFRNGGGYVREWEQMQCGIVAAWVRVWVG